MWTKFCVLVLATGLVATHTEKHERKRRYLIFPPSTQWGVFATVSIPLHPEATVSVAWFFEANYYNVANATYFDPLLGDIGGITLQSRNKHERSADQPAKGFTRSLVYTSIETLLQQHGQSGRPCLLRAICENATSHLLHNGLLGDLLHLLLTPSTSTSEDTLEDVYYEAEYFGMEDHCDQYAYDCPTNPVNLMSVFFETTS